jgi:hypothetical protein
MSSRSERKNGLKLRPTGTQRHHDVVSYWDLVVPQPPDLRLSTDAIERKREIDRPQITAMLSNRSEEWIYES